MSNIPKCNSIVNNDQYYSPGVAAAPNVISMVFWGYQASWCGASSFLFLLICFLFYSFNNSTGACIFSLLFIITSLCFSFDIYKYLNNKNSYNEIIKSESNSCVDTTGEVYTGGKVNIAGEVYTEGKVNTAEVYTEEVYTEEEVYK